MPRIPITRRRKKGKQGQRQSHKGSSYERLMARRLSVWVTGGKRTDCFWRTASSGGMATHRAQRGQKTQDQETHAGDLLLTHPKGRLFLDLFMVELKHQRTFHLEQVFFDRKSSDFLRFWKDLQAKASPIGRTPLFITKRTSMGELLTTDREGVRILRLGVRKSMTLQSVVVIPRHGMITFLLKDVIESVDFWRIRKHYAR